MLSKFKEAELELDANERELTKLKAEAFFPEAYGDGWPIRFVIVALFNPKRPGRIHRRATS